jgi:hypothetical protein
MSQDSPPLPAQEIERLRAAGYVIVPITPTAEMVNAGAPSCYQVPDGTWEAARRDAVECFAAMAAAGAMPATSADADLTQALAQCQKALALLMVGKDAIRESLGTNGWDTAVAAEARARAALEKAKVP